jgi:hypothetical protein
MKLSASTFRDDKMLKIIRISLFVVEIPKFSVESGILADSTKKKSFEKTLKILHPVSFPISDRKMKTFFAIPMLKTAEVFLGVKLYSAKGKQYYSFRKNNDKNVIGTTEILFFFDVQSLSSRNDIPLRDQKKSE